MTGPKKDKSNRRRFPRLKAPVFCRSARFRTARRPVVDIGLGGLRVFSDETFEPGERLDVELFLPNAVTLRALMKVAWVAAQPSGAPASFDVGMELLDIKGDGDLDELDAVLTDDLEQVC